MHSLRNILSHIAVALCSLLPLSTFAEADTCPPHQAFTEHAPEQSGAGPYARGMLWRIEHPDAPASYLFGTMHLADQLITRLPPTVALALAKADAFVAETVLDQTAMAYYQRHMFSETAPNLGSLFEQPFRRRLVALLSEYGFDRQAALRLKPWGAFTLLARPKPTGAPTLDQLLEGMARQRGIPVYALQSVEELVATLEGIPLNHQRQILIDTVCNRVAIEQQAQQLTARYLAQDLAGMVTVSSRFEPRNEVVAKVFKERMLDDRNRKMLKRLQSHLEQGNAFVAVGALHLPGKKGLLQGLEALGYRITAVH
jgi:uncharacterized protein